MLSFIFFLPLFLLVLRFSFGKTSGIFVFIGLALYAFLTVLLEGIHGVTGVGIDESVIFHWITGLEGAGLKSYNQYIAARLLSLATIWLALWWILSRQKSRKATKITLALTAAASILALATHPIVGQIRQQIPLITVVFGDNTQAQQADLGPLAPLYGLPTTKQLHSLDKNIVFVYLEGLEKNYLDEVAFGEVLTPKLLAMSENAIRFSNMGEGAHTGWTMGGLVGSQCGVPMVPLGSLDINGYTGFERFMPGATCLGDVLALQNYHTEFIGGASLRFAGKADFLQSHSIDERVGREELMTRLDEHIPRNVWGYYDDAVLDYSVQRFQQLYKQDQRFMLSTLTLDTHPPEGFLSPRCRQQLTLTDSHKIKDAVRCSDLLVSNYVNKIRELDTKNNTIVVLLTDHYSHPNSVNTQLTSKKRGLIFWVFMPEGEGGLSAKTQNIPTRGSTYDVGATLLALAGADKNVRLGFGVNMLEKSVDADYPWPKIKEHLGLLTGFLWPTVKLVADKNIELFDQRLMVEGQLLRFPIILQFDESFKVKNTLWPSYGNVLVDAFRETNAVMIERCGWAVAPSRLGDKQKYCLFYRTQSNQVLYENMPVSSIATNHIMSVLNDEVALARWDMENSVVVSSTGGKGWAGVFTPQGSVEFARGVNIFQLEHGRPQLLATFDTCGANKSRNQAQHLAATLNDATMPAYIAVKDSALCEPNTHHELLAEIMTPSLQGLGFRQAYIGVVGENQQIHKEYVSEPNTKLLVAINPENSVGRE